MKNILILSLALLSPAAAMAHGSLPDQALDALTSATHLFESTQSNDVRRQFAGISAVVAGHERFTVTVSLRNNTQVRYNCVENEDVNPVVWECAAQ